MARIFALAALAAALLAVPAHAATVEVAGGVLVYTGEPGEANDVSVGDGSVPGSLQLTDDGAHVLVPGAGCAPLGPDPDAATWGFLVPTYVCVDAESARLDTGDGDDYVDNSSEAPAELIGGDGDDIVIGYGADERLDGGAGNDLLIGYEGSDHLLGGEGADILEGDFEGFLDPPFDEDGEPFEGFEEGAEQGDPDVLDGGAGDDRLAGGGGADTLSGGDGHDRAVFLGGVAHDIALGGAAPDVIGADVEGITTGYTDDRVVGDARANLIETHRGDDTVDPGAGADEVDASHGDDLILARDGEADVVRCGPGADRAVVDAADTVAECEVVETPGGGPAVPGAPTAGDARAVLRIRAKAQRAGSGVKRLDVRGRLRLAGGVTPEGCAGHRVAVTVRGMKVRRSPVVAVLDASCEFRVAVAGRGKRGRRVTVEATFAGLTGVSPAGARAKTKLR